MAVESSTVAAHHFTVTPKRGYVVSEVDAVMSRLAATLREHERRIEDLLERTRAAEAGNGTSEKDRLELLHVGADLVARAEKESARILNETRERAAQELSRREQGIEQQLADGMREANAIAAEGRRARDEASARAASINNEADAILARARHDVLAMRKKAADEAARLIKASLSEVKRLRAATRAEAGATVEKAEAESTRIVGAAGNEADDIVKEAHAERITLNQHIAQLYTTLADLEDELLDPSATALVLRQSSTRHSASRTLASGGASRISDRLVLEVENGSRETLTIRLDEDSGASLSPNEDPTELATAVRQILDDPDPASHARSLPPRPPIDTLTWYQRRGGGIRRRMPGPPEEPAG
jgi:DivIVA domain-containing protein